MSGPPSFPRQHARTRGFTLGEPRGFSVAAGGGRVAFLRSLAGDDPVNRLWVLDLERRAERLVADPVALVGAGEELPAAERARRERARERAGGIVAYGADRDLTVAAFALSGRLFVAALAGIDEPGPGTAHAPAPGTAPGTAPAQGVVGGSGVREMPSAGPVLDPRADPTGSRVAYVSGSELHVVELEELDGGGSAAAGRRLAGEDGPEVTWGVAEFVAAEEMGRGLGYWWAPDGGRVAVARVDTGRVRRFHLTDPSNPLLEPVTLRYPAAGTANADVRLFVVDLDGRRTEIAWDRDAFPYLAKVVWAQVGPLTLLVQSRDQTAARVLAADPDSGATAALAAPHDPSWLELVPGVPAWLPGDRLVGTVDDRSCDTRRLTIGGEPVTPPGLQVLEVLAGGGGDEVLLRCSEEPTEIHVWRVRAAAGAEVALERCTRAAGVHLAAAAGDLLVLAGAGLDHDGTLTTVHRAGRQVATVASLAETPVLRPRVALLRGGERALRSALLLPSEPRDGPLPVLLDPYGGPGARRVLAARGGFLTSQWFADQGFAVLVTDGRGTPGRGPAWERAVHLDLAGPVLEDQVEALHAVAGDHPELDLGRVAIRGWSFGGYLPAQLPAGGRRRPEPAAAAHPRPRRRQRGRGAHPAALQPAAGVGPPPQRAAAVGRDPHDPAGGGGREPAPVPAHLPARGPGPARAGPGPVSRLRRAGAGRCSYPPKATAPRNAPGLRRPARRGGGAGRWRPRGSRPWGRRSGWSRLPRGRRRAARARGRPVRTA